MRNGCVGSEIKAAEEEEKRAKWQKYKNSNSKRVAKAPEAATKNGRKTENECEKINTKFLFGNHIREK